MSLIPDTFCILPWMRIENAPDGSCRPCGASKTRAAMGGREFRLGRDSIEVIWQSESFRKLRQDLLNGVKNSGCARSWWEEEKGLKSQRLHHLNVYTEIFNIVARTVTLSIYLWITRWRFPTNVNWLVVCVMPPIVRELL